MDELKGWIALYRAIVDNEFLWNDKPFARGQAWIDLLLIANHKSKKILFDGRVKKVERGAMITSVSKLANRWGWSRTKVSAFLKVLAEEDMLTYEVNQKYTSIHITNYNKIQDGDRKKAEDVQKKDSFIHTETTDKQRSVEVIHNSEMQLKCNRNATEMQLKNTNNNVNNINNVNNTRIDERVLGKYQHVVLKDFEMVSLLNELGEDKFLKVINKLDEYIERKGKEYTKPHFLVIKDWVIKAVEEDEKREQAKPKPKKVNKFNDFNQRTYTREEIDDLELRLLGLKK